MRPCAVEMTFSTRPPPSAEWPRSTGAHSHQKPRKLFTLGWFSELKEWMEAQLDIVRNRQSVDG